MAAGLLASGGMLVLGFVTTPLLLRWLGAERLGAFRAASDWAGYLALFDMGLAVALQVLFTRAYSRHDPRETTTALAVGLRAYVRVCAFMLLAGSALALAITWLVPVSPEWAGSLRLGFAIGLLPVLWLPLGAFRSLAEGSQRGYVVSGLLLLQSTLIAAFSLLFAWLGLGIPGQFLAAAIGSAAFSAGLAWRCRHAVSGLRDALRSAPQEGPLNAELSSLKWPSLVQNLCGRLSMLTDNIIICGLLGPAEVVPFFVSQRLVTLAGGQVTQVGTNTWAPLAELHYQGKRDVLNERLIELTRVTAVLALAAVIPTAVFTPAFVRLWVGEDYYGGHLLPWLAAGNAFLLAVLSVWGGLFSGAGLLRRLLASQVTQSVLNVGVSVLATWYAGLPGPLIGTFVAMSGVYLWWWPVLLRECFGTPLRPLAGAVLRPLCVAAPYAVALQLVAAASPPAGWLAVAAALGGSALAYMGLAWLLVLDPQQRSAWTGRLALVLSWRTG
jgi:O-antigen/teichoic acid export membrane protein